MRNGRLMFSAVLLLLPLLLLCGRAAGQGHPVAKVVNSPGSEPGIATTDPWSQIAKLSGQGAGAGNGASVAISGNTIVVGAPVGYGSSGSGVAYVFVKPASGWGNKIQTAQLKSSDGQFCDLLGTSVAIVGNIIVVGAPQNYYICGGYAAGAVYVFVEPPGGWTGTVTETAKLTASDGAINDALGYSISISGNTVVAGAPGTIPSSKSGAAYVFVESASGWANMTQTAKLTESDGTADDAFGLSVSVSGSTVVAGSPYASSGAGYVFVEPSGGWKNATQTAKLLASDGAAGDSLGYSVSVSGGTAAVGAPYAKIGSNAEQGAAYVFVEPAAGWSNATQTAKLTESDGLSGDYLGYSVAVNSTRVVAGASYYMRGPHTSGGGVAESYFHEGAVYVFSKPSGGWITTSSKIKLTGSDARFASYLGSSVAIGGSDVVAGAPGLERGVGAAYLFVKP